MIRFPADDEMKARAARAAEARRFEYRMFVRAAVSELRALAERHRKGAENRADHVLAICLDADALIIQEAADKIEKAAFAESQSND